MKKVAFHTLGCKLNFSETSAISRLFQDKGFQKVSFEEQPDIFVINTCSVTDHTDKKCHKIVREALKISSKAFIIIIGCYAQLKPQNIAKIPGVDVVLGAAEKFKLLDLITSFEKKPTPQVHVTTIQEAIKFHHAHSIGDRTRTFLKIQDGCNYRCTFCTIPLARGKSRSDTIENIVQQAKKIAHTEVKEIVLTGVNTGDYGIIDGHRATNFFNLIQALDQVEGIARFRISSIEPNLLHNDIITFVAKSKRFVPHFHIPLQSGSDKILKRMQRRYQKTLYAERIATIKALMPQCCIGVDVIVGFPGETEADFLATYGFLNTLDVAYLHVFPYSERPNTPAVDLADSVPYQMRSQRANRLRILSEKKQRHFYEKNLGHMATVLFEKQEKDGFIRGFTENYIRVATPYDASLSNTLNKVLLKSIRADGLVAVEVPVVVAAS